MVEALLGAAATLMATGFGWLLHRGRERVRWEEEAQGELAKLRYSALIEMLKALGRLYWWRVRALDKDEEVSNEERLTAASEAEKTASEVMRLFASQLFLVPHEARSVLRDALVGIGSADTPAALRATAVALG